MIKLLFSLYISVLSFSFLNFSNRSTCGMSDDRLPSTDPKVGYVKYDDSDATTCTITMISKNCALTAGHCINNLKKIHFNTSNIILAPQQNIYLVDRNSISFRSQGPGDDFLVMKLLKNHITKKYAGDVQGYYQVDMNEYNTKMGSLITITGYGYDPEEDFFSKELTNSTEKQRVHIGHVQKTDNDFHYGRSESIFTHSADTSPGNSGSSIILVNSQKIIGIHTHGGCDTDTGGNYNMGTFISKHPVLMASIEQCLSSSKNN